MALASNNLKNIFITGANRGIGIALVKESIARNYYVLGTFRNQKNSKELLNIKYEYAEFLKMDVIDENSILKISSNIKHSIDYLVCNAGVNNGFGTLFDEDHSQKKMLEVLNVNVLGTILTVKHLSKFLNKNAKIILISSILGVQKHKGSNALIYRASKAALNNVMVSLSEEFYSRNIMACSFHPGWVRTDMGGPNAHISTKESASSLIYNFEKLKFSDSGKFFNYDGSLINF